MALLLPPGMVLPVRLVLILLALVLPVFSGCLDDPPAPVRDGEEATTDERVLKVHSHESKTTSCLPAEMLLQRCLDSHIRVLLGCDSPQGLVLNHTHPLGGAPTVVPTEAAPPPGDEPAPWVRCTYDVSTSAEGHAVLPQSNITFRFDENGNTSRAGCYAKGPLGQCRIGPRETSGEFTFSGANETVTLLIMVKGWIHHFGEPQVSSAKHEHLLAVTVST